MSSREMGSCYVSIYMTDSLIIVSPALARSLTRSFMLYNMIACKKNWSLS